MCRGLRFNILIYSLHLNCVVVMAILADCACGNDGFRASFRDSGVTLQCGKCFTGEQFDISINKGTAIPFLHYPVVKDLVCRRCSCRTCAYARIILILCVVGRSIASAVDIIDDADTVCADDDFTPLRVEIELFRDPEAVNVCVGRGAVPPFVHGIGKVRGLIVCCSYRGLIKLHTASEGFRARFVSIPAVKLIASPCSGRR